MISLPQVHSYEPNKLPVPVNRDNMIVIAALKKGTKLFEQTGFACSIPPRGDVPYHIRMSQIGDCARKQWLYMNQPEEMAKNELESAYKSEGIRATNIGSILEEYTIALLNLGGLKVYGEQTDVADHNGLITGHIDGLLKINMTSHLIELKALNMNSASKIVSKGVKEGNIVYYSQMQYYMYCLGLETGYFIAFIKDSGQYYVELVDAEPNFQKLLRQRAIVIGHSMKIEDIPDRHIVRECTFCPAKDICARLDGGNKEFVRKFKEFHHL